MKSIVEEPVLLVPKVEAVFVDAVERFGDVDHLVEVMERTVFVGRVVLAELQTHSQHRLRVKDHPCGAVRLLEVASGRELGAAVEHPDVVEPQKAALEKVATFEPLAMQPPIEISAQPLEDGLQPTNVTLVAATGLVVLKHRQRREGVNRRIDVVECPLVCGDRAVVAHVAFFQEERELVLRKLHIDEHQRERMESRIPNGEPRILPLVGHREDVVCLEVLPAFVAAVRLTSRQPLRDVVAVALFRPEHSTQGLAEQRELLVFEPHR